MTTLENELAAIVTLKVQIANLKLAEIKFAVRRTYRSSSELEKRCWLWANNLSPKVIGMIKEILSYTDGSYSILNIANHSLKGKQIK